MSQLSQSIQPPNLQKRDSIFSHHSIPNLNAPQSAEPSQQEQQVPSFQFIESVPTTMMKSSFKFTAGGETTPSISIIPGDCDLKYYKSTASSNGPFLIRDNDEHQLSHRTASLNLVADAVSMNNIDDQKSTAKFGAPQRVFFQLNNNESYFPQDDQEDLRDSMCPSGGSRRLLTDQTPTERQAGDGKQKTLDGGFTKNYRQLNEEKDISSGSYSDNRTSTRYIKEKINLFPIVEDENGSPLHARTPNSNRNQRNSHQTPNRRPTGHGNSHRADNSPQEIALNLFPDAIQNSPQNSLSPQFLIRREDGLSPNSGNVQLVNPWEAPVDREDAQITLETKLYMKRMLAVYATVSLFSVFLYLAVNDHITFQALFGVILGYLVYYVIENIVRTCYFQREIWRDTEDVYNILDAFCGIIFLALAQMKYSGIVSVSMISFIPFLATTGAYYMFAKAPRVVRNAKTLLRCFYTMQVFMITAKLDKVFDWDWRIIIGLTWICIGVIGIRSTVLTISQILKLAGNKLRRRTRQSTTVLLVEFSGAIWKLFGYILYVVGFIALFGCSQAFLASEKQFGLLKLSAIIGFGLTVALILYTLILFKPLLQYLKKFQRFYTPPARQIQPPQMLKKQSTINLEVEKHHKSYFVMLSPTYFLPLKNGFIAKKEENIKRIKKMLYSLRVWKSKKPHAGTVASPKAANIEELKQDKDALDEKFSKLASMNVNININEGGDGMPKEPRSTRPRAPTSIFIEHLTGFFNREKESLSTIGGMDTGRKQNLSADDLHYNRLSIQKTGKAHSEENLCYLCFDNVPNAVLMGCGHGGICYDCANELVKKKNECMECRSSVEAIYKVDANLKVCDIIKGVELTKVCVSP